MLPVSTADHGTGALVTSPSLQSMLPPGQMPLGLCHQCCFEFVMAGQHGFKGGVPQVDAAVTLVGKPEVQAIRGMGQVAGIIVVGICGRHLMPHNARNVGVIAAQPGVVPGRPG